MIMFIMCGVHGSGKSTSTEEVKAFCEMYDHTCMVISDRDSAGKYRSPKDITFDIYRTVHKDPDMCIVEGGLNDAFDRQNAVNIAKEAAADARTDLELKIVAIQHDRTDKWVQAVAGLSFVDARNSGAVTQPPIKREGHNMIYHVRYGHHLNLSGLMHTMNMVLGTTYPIPPQPQKEETPEVADEVVTNDCEAADDSE